MSEQDPLQAAVLLVDKDGYSVYFAAVVTGKDDAELMSNSWNKVAERVILSRVSGRVPRQPEDFVIQWPGGPPVPKRPLRITFPKPQEVAGVGTKELCRVS